MRVDAGPACWRRLRSRRVRAGRCYQGRRWCPVSCFVLVGLHLVRGFTEMMRGN